MFKFLSNLLATFYVQPFIIVLMMFGGTRWNVNKKDYDKDYLYNKEDEKLDKETEK